MDQFKLNKLQSIAESGYNFRFGDYIGEGYKLFKKDIGSFVGFTAVFMVIAIFSSVIPYVGSFAFSLLVAPSLVGGYYIYAHKLDKGEPTEFGDFFKGFDYFVPFLFAALVSMLVSLLCFSPFLGTYLQILSGDTEAILNFSYSWWMVLCVLPIIYVSVAWLWAQLFIIFYDMPFWDAMEMSRKLITQKWLTIFVFGFVLGIIVMLGVIAFCVGILFTIPIYYCAMYIAFADVTGLMDGEEEMGLEDHLVD